MSLDGIRHDKKYSLVGPITKKEMETTLEDTTVTVSGMTTATGYLKAAVSLCPSEYDEIDLTYTDGEVTGVVYKLAAATVSTLTLTYTDGVLTKVAKS